jgi:16S rRNA U516 pseudouridylate synthase RsuA-like enzyme
MFAAVGLEVRGLARVAVGGLRLGALAAGQWRRISKAEAERIKEPFLFSP